MPLNEFKTQVLLLHSEQSALEHLSADFDDRYTVHCATSGSEALQTLSELPIDVIVSAQDLPGMSGLEALREAKRRSPETVRILLVGNLDVGQEALVSDTELFEVVRGNVTSDSIRELVESATQKLQTITLAEPANDIAVDPGDPSGELINDEHIIMETASDGEPLISDGSGRLPALDANRAARAAAGQSPSVDMLVLTKDEEFLETIRDSSHDRHGVHYANTLAEADEIIRQRGVGVTVIDAGMIGKRIEQLIEYLRRGSPRLVFIVAGRRDDGEMLMDLINRGKVYRFLLKPVSPGRARLAIEASAKHHLDAPDAVFANKPSSLASEIPAANDESQDRTHASEAAGGASPDDAFGGSEAGFGDTLSDLFRTVNEKLSGLKEKDAADDTSAALESAPARKTSLPGGKSTVFAGIAVAAVIGIGYLLFAGGKDDATSREISAASSTPVERQALPPTETLPAVEAAPVAPAGAAVEAEETGFFAEDTPLTEALVDNVDSELVTEPPFPTEAAVSDDGIALVQGALAVAERALLESRLGDAEVALQQVSLLDPDNARLPFLDAQVTQAKLRSHLSAARNAMLAGSFEDADTALQKARSMNLGDATEIDAVAEELQLARSQKLADDVLAMANKRLQAGALISPREDNARYFFELVLVNDPANTTAREGLSVVASKLALEARAAIENGDLDTAQGLLRPASALEPSNSEVASAEALLASARRKAQPPPDKDVPEKARPLASSEARAAPADETPAAINNEKAVAADAPAAENPAPAAAAIDSVTDEPEAAREMPTASSDTPVMVTSLNRRKYVAPKYPRSAQRRNLAGWVDVLFTVDTDGTVKDVTVQDSEPGEVFVGAAIRAVEKWEFEPVVEDGSVVEKRAGVRMMFALE